MSKKMPGKLKGFRDFLPLEKRKRDFVKSKIEEVFNRYGFSSIETPTLESATLLLGKYGNEADKLVYTFKDKGDREVGLRYDQTVPTARVLGENKNELPTYFRRYQIQSVFRAEKPQKGRYREIVQCDVDIFGAKEGIADAEILSCTFDVFKNIGINEVQLAVNDRNVLIDIVKRFETKVVNVFSIIQSIDKLDKISREDVIKELEGKGLAFKSAEKCLNEVYNAKVSPALKKIFKLAVLLGIPEDRLAFTPYLARGLDYYTGMIFEVRLPNKSSSLGGGGRYDNLVEELGGDSIPAVGVGLGFDRIVEFADENGLIKIENDKKAFVTVFSETLVGNALALSAKLRSLGVNTEVYIGKTGNIGKQFKYANKLNCKYVFVVGEEEVNNGTIVVKNMKNGTQKVLKMEDLKIWANNL